MSRAKKWRKNGVRRRFGSRNERGAVLVFVAVSLVGIIGFSGLAVDLGVGYVAKIRLSRAVDAAAIAAASAIRLGQATAEQQGRAVAALNGVVDGADGVTLSMAFGTNAEGEQTVSVAASRPVATTLMRILGQDVMQVSSVAVAAVAPVDMTLVLDQSGSLRSQGAWDDLQAAASNFVGYFSDALDQVGMVHFQVRANDSFLINNFFNTPIRNAISNMNSAGDTNTGEGLRYAYQQMEAASLRPRSGKVVVFFTDGRPTAFRDIIGGEDRAIAVSTVNTGRVRGYFNNPDALQMNRLANPNGCRSVSSCFGWTETSVRNTARVKGQEWADSIRSAGYLLYTIGLGNPSARDPILQPDMNYLDSLANVSGIMDSNQPQGQSYFAPSAAELGAVFDQVAKDLLVHLTK